MSTYSLYVILFFFFSSRRRHTRYIGDWSSDVCSSDLDEVGIQPAIAARNHDTFISLGALARTFDHVDVDDDGVARRKVGDVFAETGNLFLLKLLDQVHF